MKSLTLVHRLIAAPLNATSHCVRHAALALALLVASASVSFAQVTVTATNVVTATNNSGALWSAQAGRRSDHGPRYRPTSNISPSRLQFNIFQNLAIRRDSLIL